MQRSSYSLFWPFGNMLADEGLTRGDVNMITAKLGELQRANGIN